MLQILQKPLYGCEDSSRDLHSPVLHRSERLLVSDVIHEDEAHGSTIVRRGDGAVSLLPGSILDNTHKTAFLVWTLI